MAWVRGVPPIPVTIVSGESLSSAALNAGVLRGIYVAAWTAATMAFLVSNDGVTYKPLLKDNTEIAFAVTADKHLTGADLELLMGFRYLKIQSGATGTLVNQGADRVIYLTYVTEA